MRKYLTEDDTSKFRSWVSIYKTFNSSLFVEKAGYFDERPVVHTSVTQILAFVLLLVLPFFTLWSLLLIPFLFFGWLSVYINLPIKTGIEDCDSAAYGINYHDNTLWFYVGGAGNFEGGKKWKTITMPWSKKWVRTSVLLKDGSWEHERPGEHKGFYGEEWDKVIYKEEYPYKYTLKSGEVQNVTATVHVKEREWRPIWLSWTKLFAKVIRTIEVDFNDEIGEKTGSWKGGVIGTGHNMLPGETVLESLTRMQKERKF